MKRIMTLSIAAAMTALAGQTAFAQFIPIQPGFPLQPVPGITGQATPGNLTEQTMVVPDVVGSFVPTVLIQGDREFGGHGPRITVTVEVFPFNDGLQLAAQIRFHAIETQSNFSETSRAWGPIILASAPDNRRIVGVVGQDTSEIVFVSPPSRNVADAGLAAGANVFGDPANTLGVEDGGCLCRAINSGGGPVASIVVLGDTFGDDISTDENAYGDTSLRRITFRPILVQLSPN